MDPDEKMVKEMEAELLQLDADFSSGQMGAFGDRQTEERVRKQLEQLRQRQWALAMFQVTVEDHRIVEPDLDNDPEESVPEREQIGSADTSTKTKGKVYQKMSQFFDKQEEEYGKLKGDLGTLAGVLESLPPILNTIDNSKKEGDRL